MNTSDLDTSTLHDDDGFDARARQAHAAAQGALSPRVRAQLQQRRRAALAGPRKAQGVRWVPTLTMAATLALALGLGMRFWSPAPLETGTGVPTTAMTDTKADVTPAASAGHVSGTDARSGTPVPAMADGRGEAGTTRVSVGTDAGRADDARTTGASTGRLDADVDAIAALLAVSVTEDGDPATDVESLDAARDDALLAALEESPDFYLWLGADDGAGVEAL